MLGQINFLMNFVMAMGIGLHNSYYVPLETDGNFVSFLKDLFEEKTFKHVFTFTLSMSSSVLIFPEIIWLYYIMLFASLHVASQLLLVQSIY